MIEYDRCIRVPTIEIQSSRESNPPFLAIFEHGGHKITCVTEIEMRMRAAYPDNRGQPIDAMCKLTGHDENFVMKDVLILHSGFTTFRLSPDMNEGFMNFDAHGIQADLFAIHEFKDDLWNRIQDNFEYSFPKVRACATTFYLLTEQELALVHLMNA